MNARPTNRTTRGITFVWRLIWLGMAIGLLLSVGVAIAAVSISDINPNTSTNGNVNASSGGRVNGLANDPGNTQVFYAASEYGGLFKTTDGGANWSRLNGHLPVVTWDVEVDPANSNTVYATSFYDGRVNSLAGIEVSYDAGTTWTHPASAVPPATFNCAAARRTEASAFGIGIRPDASQNVVVGTNCGVAISADSGGTWTFVDPTPATPASNVWDVVVQTGGTIDVCGDDGHFRSTNGGVNWAGGAAALPGGVCSIAVSPDESYVLFVAVGTRIFESDDAGATWPTEFANPAAQGRIPFVTTNQRSDSGGTNRFSLWFGDVQLFRADCTTPATPAQGGAARCPASGSWSNQQTGAHWDGGDLVFTAGGAADACPRIYSSDGGVHRNTDLGSNCQNPTWVRSNVGLHTLWLWAMDGANQAGDANEDLYFGNQDTGTFAATDAGAAAPTWANPNCCDTFDMLADSNWVLGTTCCFPAPARRNQLQLANAGYTSPAQINTYPAGTVPGFTWAKRLGQFGTNQVVLLTTSGVFITNNITANPIVWNQLGAASTPANGCGIHTAVAGGTPTFYLQVGGCTAATGDQVWSYTGTATGGTWQRIDDNDGLTGGFGVFAVDPNDPNRMYASNLALGGPQMVSSTDGGQNWNTDTELDNLMTGGGIFQYQNQRGPVTARGSARINFNGYPQPSLLAYDPENPNILVAGGQDSGVFISTDGGRDWVLKTDPFNSGASGIPHLPRPRYAYFDHEPANKIQIYIGTQGRGVWRLSLDPPPVAEANGPYVTNEGIDVPLNVTGSSDPDGSTLTYAWDFDGDGEFDDASGDPAVFNRVGQDGVFTIALRVTDADGFSAIDTTTVTVNNVAPSISLASDAPKDEGSPLTVNGTATDPGWLDPLTATIDWGDGSPVEPIAGTLENIRPDATLSFGVSHTYGDNGNYNVQVCASDDDTTTCQVIVVQINNVPPQVAIAPGQVTQIDEGDLVNILANFSDPGWLDTYISLIDWGTGESEAGNLTVTVNGPPVDQGSVSGSHRYGDNGVFAVKVSVTDDDGGVGSASFDLNVKNVNPTAKIDETGLRVINGVPTFLNHAGNPIDFNGRSQDPGSDDLFLSWDWDDGPPAPDVTTTYLVNPPNPDPFPSPSVQPRDVTDTQSHAFADACLYTIRFKSVDDDGGAGTDTATVLVVGNDDKAHPQGYWQHQFSRVGHTDFDEATLKCYLAIINHVSRVFTEQRDASTIAKAYDVLFMQQNGGSAIEQFDRELLTVWLNFANGAFEYERIAEVVAAAETVRLNPHATESEIRKQTNILRRIKP